MEDYYKLLKVDRAASREEIEKKIKDARFTWTKRQNLPDPDKRHEAERMIRLLGEAQGTLLDDARRQDYDRQLAETPEPQEPPVPSSAAQGDWLAQARDALGMNDYFTARYAAREARERIGSTAEVWSILARANSGLGHNEDAVVEAQQAVRLEPDNPDHLYTLATIFEEMGNWPGAINCYETASRIVPADDMPRIGLGSVLLRSGDTARALSVLEAVYASSTDKELAGSYLAMALLTAAERVPRSRDGDMYVITDRAEIGQMRGMLARVAQVTTNAQLLAELPRTTAYIDRCASRKFVARRAFGGCLGRLILGFWVVVILAMLVGVLVVTIPAPLFLIPFTVVLGFLFYLTGVVPRWKLNAQAEQAKARLRQQADSLPR